MSNAQDLSSLIALWRETRDPALGAIVVAVGAAVSVDDMKAFDGLKPAKLAPAISAALSQLSPEKVHAFLPVLERFLRSARGIWPIVELLAELPPDPRFATLAVALLQDIQALPGASGKLWRRLVDVVERHGDPSCVVALTQLTTRGNVTPGEITRLKNVAKRLGKVTAVPPAELERLRSLATRPPKRAERSTKPRAEELLQAVYDEPDSDDARLVLADWLSQQGDPRGEFIVLQLERAAGTLTAAGARREGALLRKHFFEWIEPIRAIVPADGRLDPPKRETSPEELAAPIKGYYDTTFVKGFLHRVQALAVPKHRRAALDHPIWATVRELDRAPAFSSAMRSLAVVNDCVQEALPSLTTLGRPLESLTVRGGEQPSPLVPAEGWLAKRLAIGVYSSSRGAVRGWLRAVAASPTVEALELVGTRYVDFGHAWDWTPLDEAPPQLARVRLQIDEGEHLDLERVAGRWSKVTVRARTLSAHDEWRQVFAPFAGRPAATLTVHVDPKLRRSAGAAFEAAMMDFAREVSVRFD